MSNIPINNLPAAITVTGTEIVPAVQDNTTVRITLNQIKSIISAQGTVTDITAIAPIGGGVITTSGSISLDPQGVTNGYLGPMAAGTIKGNATSASASPQDLTATETLGLLGIGGIATGTFLGNISGVPADPTAITLTDYIDTEIGNTQGSILYRNNSQWTALPAGISGQYLTTQGPTDNPQWTSLPAPANVTSVSTGTGLTGGPITTTGTISIANTGVILGGYGSSSSVPSLTVNAQGQLTAAQNINIDGIALTTGTISSTPVNATDLVNKQYADLVAAGLKFHAACNYATTANLTSTYNNGTAGVGATLTGTVATLSVDGGTPPVGNRVLVHNQSNAAENGVYTVTTTGTTASWVLTRATDYNSAGILPNQINQGDFIFIISGDRYGSSSWVQQTPLPIVVGTTDIIFVQFSSISTYFAGTGLTLTGQTFSITNTGVTAGSYGAPSQVGLFTVNAQGQITSASSQSIQLDASAITTGALGVARGGTGLQSYTAGNLLYATGTTTLAGLPIGTTGQVLTMSGGLPTWVNSNGGVTSFNAGTTGLLPTGATQGAITLSGTLNIANGGTGATTASGIRTNLGLGTMSIQDANAVAIVGGAINGTVIGATAPAAVNGTTFASTFGMTSGPYGVYSYGTLGYNDASIMASFASNTTSYNQFVIQNTSNNPAASTNYNVSNDAATTTANFGEFGINSSAFAGTGSFGIAGATYLASASTDLAIGTYAAKPIHFVVNGNSTTPIEAITIASNGNVSFPTTGAITLPVGNTAAQPAGPVAGMLRFNSQTSLFEGYTGTGSVWTTLGGGVSSFSTGSTGLTASPSTGAVVLAGILNPASGGTGVNNGTNTLTLAGNLSTVGAFPIALTATAATAITLPTSGTLVTTAATQTLTNKRVTPRVVSIATATTITPPADDCDTYDVTALASGAIMGVPSGTPTNSQKILIRIFSPTTARALDWANPIWRPIGVTPPATTAADKWTYIGIVYNSQGSKWDVIAVGQQA